MLTGGGPGAATRYIGLYIWRVVFPKTDYGYGAAMSLLTLYLTIVLCWLLYVGTGAAAPAAGGERLMAGRTQGRASLSAPGSLLSLVTLVPIYWMFVVSAKSRVELFGRPTFLIKSFYTANYANRDRRSDLPAATWSTRSMSRPRTPCWSPRWPCSRPMRCRAFPGRPGQHLLLDDHQPHGAAGGVPAALVPVVHPGVRGRRLALFDTRLGLILLYCVFNLPFAIWLLKGMIDAHPGRARRGGDAGRRRHLGQILTQGDRAAGPPRPRRDRDPVLGVRLERVSVRGDAHQRRTRAPSPRASPSSSP